MGGPWKREGMERNKPYYLILKASKGRQGMWTSPQGPGLVVGGGGKEEVKQGDNLLNQQF